MNFDHLKRPFEENQIRERKGKKVNGQYLYFRYVPSEFVVERLNELGPGNWSFVIKESKVIANEVVVLGSLRIANTVKEAFGSSTIDEKKTAADSFKAASALSLTKCASLYSVPCIFHTKPNTYQQPQTSQNNYQSNQSQNEREFFQYTCDDCNVVISKAEVDFTKKYPQTYNDKQVCRTCQQKYRKGIIRRVQ